MSLGESKLIDYSENTSYSLNYKLFIESTQQAVSKQKARFED